MVLQIRAVAAGAGAQCASERQFCSGIMPAEEDVEGEGPTKEEVEDFIKANTVDERASADLRECAPEVQRKVLSRGDLSSARNPSAAVLVRIRDARLGNSTSSPPSGGGVGLPSSKEIDNYIKTNQINEKGAKTLRSSSPTMKRAVLNSGDMRGAADPSALLLARIKDIRSGGNGQINAASVVGIAPTADEVEDFIKVNDLDTSAASSLRSCPSHVQQVVLSRGDLRGTRNPSSAVLARIKEAKAAPPPHPHTGAYPYGMPHPGHYPPPGYPGGPPPPGMYGYAPHGYMGYSSGYPPGYYGPPGYPPPGYPQPYGAYPPGPGGAGPPPTADGLQKGRSCSRSSYSYSGSYSSSRSRSQAKSRSRAKGRSRSHSHSRSRSHSRSLSRSRSRKRARSRGRDRKEGKAKVSKVKVKRK